MKVDLFVLGAPKLRNFQGEWELIIESFASKLSTTDIKVGVENICTFSCTKSPFGTMPLHQFGFQKVFDVANAFDCNSKCYESWNKDHSFVYSHLAALGHSLPKSKESYKYIKNLVLDFGITERCSWEFNFDSEGQFIEALRTLRNFDSENLGDCSLDPS